MKLVDEIQSTNAPGNWRLKLDELVYTSYGVTSSERQTIEDFLGTVMDRYYRRLQASAFDPPSTDELTGYAQAFTEVFEKTTGESRSLAPTVYQGTPPYRAVSFHLAQGDPQSTSPVVVSEPELDNLLARLERIATEQHAQSLYFRRNIKVYEPEAIHMVKPAEKRFWTRSVAYNDADETIAQLMRTMSRQHNG